MRSLLVLIAVLVLVSMAFTDVSVAAAPADNLHELAVLLGKEEPTNATVAHSLYGPGNGSLRAATPAKEKAAYGELLASYLKIEGAIDVSYPAQATGVAAQIWSDARQLLRFAVTQFRGLRAIAGPGNEIALTRYECAFGTRTRLAHEENAYRLQIAADIKQLGRTDGDFAHLRWSAAKTPSTDLDFDNVYSCIGAANGAGAVLAAKAAKLSRPEIARQVAALKAAYAGLVQATARWPKQELADAFRRASTTGAAYWSYENAVFERTASYSKTRERVLFNSSNAATVHLFAEIKTAGAG